MRDEFLNETLFFGLDHVRQMLAAWVDSYNHDRPHSSLGYRTPVAYERTLTASGAGPALLDGSGPPPLAPIAEKRENAARTLIGTG